MEKRAVSGMALTLLLILMVSLQLDPMQAKAQPLELCYDDGEADQGDAVIANQILGWGVKFDRPKIGFAYRIEGVKFYIFMGQEPLRLFVYLRCQSTSAYEKVFENVVGPLTLGWNIIDLTSYNIVTDEDFIVGFNWVFDQTPYLGVDVDKESHSGTFETHDPTTFNRIFGFFNYMIRAYVTPSALVSTTIDLYPEALNLKSRGNWITAYIQLPEGYSATDIDAPTILLNGTIAPVLGPEYGFVTDPSGYLVDHNNDGIPERMVKFDSSEVKALLSVGEATLTLTGKVNGIPFQGSDTIKVLG